MKHKNFTATKYSYLCSEHFGPNDYQIRPGADIKLLLEYAVLSIFKGFPTHLQKKKFVFVFYLILYLKKHNML